MKALGPLFGDGAIDGPILVHYFDLNGIHFYLVGERHSLNGIDRDHPKNHAIQQLVAYCQTHRVRCYSESTEKDCMYNYYELSKHTQAGQTMCHAARSPLTAHLGHVATRRISCENVFADIRKLPPYNMYTLIIDPLVYMLERHNTLFEPTVERRVRKFAKKAEKLVIRHVATRNQAKSLLEALCLPDHSYPPWFVSLYKEIEETEESPPDTLRDMMRSMRDAHPGIYKAIVSHIRSYYKRWAMTPYSRAHTRVSLVVAQTDPAARALFIELSTFLLDIFVVLDLFLRESEMRPGDTILVLTGAAHSEHILRFFESLFPIEVRSKFDNTGRIPAGAPMSVETFTNHMPDILVALENKPKRHA
jgi:hypothetical protein